MAAKIMLVEDDTNLSEIYQARLEAEGYTITSTKDGEEALAKAVKERPDLIICDVMMPKISGFDMLDILRGTDGIKDTKVIMMTALGQAEDKARAEKLGADRYLVKSQVTLEDVISTVHDVLADSADKSAAGSTSQPASGVSVASSTPLSNFEPAKPLPTAAATTTPIPVVTPPATPPTSPNQSVSNETQAASTNDTPTPPDQPSPTSTPTPPAPTTQPTNPSVDNIAIDSDGNIQNANNQSIPIVSTPVTDTPKEVATTPPATTPVTTPAPQINPPTAEKPTAFDQSATVNTAPQKPVEQPPTTPSAQTTPPVDSQPTAPTTPTISHPEPALDQTTPKPIDVVNASNDSAQADRGTGLAGKKVIQPTANFLNQPDINELLAEEQVDEAFSEKPSNAGIQPTVSGLPPSDPNVVQPTDIAI